MHCRADVNACGQARCEKFTRERLGSLPLRECRHHQQRRLHCTSRQGASMRFVVMLIVLIFPVLDVIATMRFARWSGIPMSALMIAPAIAGSLLLRHERVAFRAKTLAALRGDQPLLRGLLDSGRKILAGILLIVPGVVSDLMALTLLLLPINLGASFAPMHAGTARPWIEGDFHRLD